MKELDIDDVISRLDRIFDELLDYDQEYAVILGAAIQCIVDKYNDEEEIFI